MAATAAFIHSTHDAIARFIGLEACLALAGKLSVERGRTSPLAASTICILLDGYLVKKGIRKASLFNLFQLNDELMLMNRNCNSNTYVEVFIAS